MWLLRSLLLLLLVMIASVCVGNMGRGIMDLGDKRIAQRIRPAERQMRRTIMIVKHMMMVMLRARSGLQFVRMGKSRIRRRIIARRGMPAERSTLRSARQGAQTITTTTGVVLAMGRRGRQVLVTIVAVVVVVGMYLMGSASTTTSAASQNPASSSPRTIHRTIMRATRLFYPAGETSRCIGGGVVVVVVVVRVDMAIFGRG